MAWPVCDGRRRARPATQLGRLAGESMEFMDHREYQPGDDLRRLDWAAYARSDKMIVKLYRQEVCPHLDIVLDGSRSMALPDSEKLHASLALAAALSTAAGNTGHSHRVYLTGQGCRPVANGGEQPLLWQGLTFDSRESPPESLRTLPPAWRPRGIRAIVSDLLWLDDPRELLMNMSDRAAAVYVIQVLAAADVAPPDHGNVRLVDSESEQVEELFLDATAKRVTATNSNGTAKTGTARPGKPAPSSCRWWRRKSAATGIFPSWWRPASSRFDWRLIDGFDITTDASGPVGAAALVAVYWLRNRSRRVVVSSLVFWSDVRRPRRGGLILQRLQTPLCFFLELLAIALLVAAAAGPAILSREIVRPLVVVLDDSYSMLARSRRRGPRIAPHAGGGGPRKGIGTRTTRSASSWPARSRVCWANRCARRCKSASV